MNEILRNRVKELKIKQNVSYIEVASYLEVHRNSFYNWLKGYFNLSEENQMKLETILDNLEV